jgi:hypothetical protein
MHKLYNLCIFKSYKQYFGRFYKLVLVKLYREVFHLSFTANSDQTRYKSNKLKLLSMKDYIWQRIH